MVWSRVLNATLALLLLWVGSSGAAQPPGAPGLPPLAGSAAPPALMLLNQKSVQNDLKLTKDQVRDIRNVVTQQMPARRPTFARPSEADMTKMREAMETASKAAVAVLTDKQETRLRQITLQLQGSRAFSDTEVAGKLGLSDEQQQSIQKIVSSNSPSSPGNGRPAQPDSMFKQNSRADKKALAKILATLTSDQRATWKEMTGKTFDGKIDFGMPPRP